MIIGTTGFDNQPFFKGMTGDLAGDLAINTINPLKHTSPFGSKVAFTILADDFV